MASRVLFVCVGNRVRSAFAEFYLRNWFTKRGLDIAVSSAGFIPQILTDRLAELNIPSPQPFYNRPMSELTMAALLEKGFRVPKGWRSKKLTLEMIKETDLLITALPAQKEDILSLYKEAQNKVFTIRDLAKRDDYLFFEDISIPSYNDNFWHYVEEDPQYVSRTLQTWEQTLIGAIPKIIERLGIRAREKNG
jgi:protein-tyrosine-phosphatase